MEQAETSEILEDVIDEQPEDTGTQDDGADAEESETEETLEASDNPDEESGESDEYDEIEYEGEKYSVPKDLKDAFLRQADYTQKTTEVAEQRRQLEQQAQQFQEQVQLQQANLQGHAQLAALQSQLQQYEGVDWTAFSENDPGAAQQAFFQYQQLKDAEQNLSRQVQAQQAETLRQQHEYHARQLEQGKAELQRDIPGWNAEMAQKIQDHGKAYGFSDSELKTVADPRMVKVLHDAMLYRQSLNAATKKPSVKAKPAKKVSGKAKGKPNLNDPNMSMDEYMRLRNKQLASR